MVREGRREEEGREERGEEGEKGERKVRGVRGVRGVKGRLIVFTEENGLPEFNAFLERNVHLMNGGLFLEYQSIATIFPSLPPLTPSLTSSPSLSPSLFVLM